MVHRPPFSKDSFITQEGVPQKWIIRGGGRGKIETNACCKHHIFDHKEMVCSKISVFSEAFCIYQTHRRGKIGVGINWRR